VEDSYAGKLARTPILLIAGLFVFCITSGVNVFAQGHDADLENRVFNLGILRAGRSNSKSAKENVDPKVLFTQVQEDFTAIHVTNNELAEVLERKILWISTWLQNQLLRYACVPPDSWKT
jgi:hypothetical protein